jgi:hypothetical protein
MAFSSVHLRDYGDYAVTVTAYSFHGIGPLLDIFNADTSPLP